MLHARLHGGDGAHTHGHARAAQPVTGGICLHIRPSYALPPSLVHRRRPGGRGVPGVTTAARHGSDTASELLAVMVSQGGPCFC
jgi:hypothetical protein